VKCRFLAGKFPIPRALKEADKETIVSPYLADHSCIAPSSRVIVTRGWIFRGNEEGSVSNRGTVVEPNNAGNNKASRRSVSVNILLRL
jgi:hypothetical protein